MASKNFIKLNVCWFLGTLQLSAAGSFRTQKYQILLIFTLSKSFVCRKTSFFRSSLVHFVYVISSFMTSLPHRLPKQFHNTFPFFLGNLRPKQSGKINIKNRGTTEWKFHSEFLFPCRILRKRKSRKLLLFIYVHAEGDKCLKPQTSSRQISFKNKHLDSC